jgi:FdhD protein
MTELPPPIAEFDVTLWRGAPEPGSRVLPEETAVAITYERSTFAVMMASPSDLQDFALGFSLSEGIIGSASDITALEVLALPDGIECRMALSSARGLALERRRRRMTGPVGCGLCGMDSLAEATRAPAGVTAALRLSPAEIQTAMSRLGELQRLNRQTRGVHAAAFYHPGTGEIMLREDVGRHNALDKLIGAVSKAGIPGAAGAVLLTSRLSIELIQKTAMLGAGILVAISVPSARAVREARAAGITLVAVARPDGFEVFSHPERIAF